MRRYKWFGLRLLSLDWWGAVSYTVGVGLYIGAAVSSIINDCPNTLLAPDVYVRHLPLLRRTSASNVSHGLLFAVSCAVRFGLYIGAALAFIINDCPNTLLAHDLYVRHPPLLPCISGSSMSHGLLCAVSSIVDRKARRFVS